MKQKTIQKMADKGLISKELLAEAGILDEDEAAEEEIELVPVTEHVTLKQTVQEMMIVMALWLAVMELAGIWWFEDKLGIGLGFLAGVLVAAAMVVHIAWTLDWAVDLEEKAAKAKIRLHAILRYLAVVGIFALILFTGVLNPIAAFVGILALKVSAYLQPLTHKAFKAFSERRKREKT